MTETPDTTGLAEINTIPEVAAYLRVSEATVKRAIARGDLTVLRPGPQAVRITRQAVTDWTNGRRQETPQ